VEAMIVGAVFIGIPWVLGAIYRSYLSHQRFMKVLQLKAEMNARLLDRVGHDPAALDFLKGDAQQQLFDVKISETASQVPTAYGRALTSLQASLILLCAGAGFLWMRQSMAGRDHEAFLVFGTLGVALGVGALLSSVAALVAARLFSSGGEARA